MYIFCILHQTTTARKDEEYIHALYIFCILHQTTTLYSILTINSELYIFCILHQTTTIKRLSSLKFGCISFVSYIKPQLNNDINGNPRCCISFVSYIKPQLGIWRYNSRVVVYLLYPTSNHNRWDEQYGSSKVVYLLYPTSNHNFVLLSSWPHQLYIFCILHQTTTSTFSSYGRQSCISFVSYIKPQLVYLSILYRRVVYLLYPTSNHNPTKDLIRIGAVVYLLYPTSNHNAFSYLTLFA